MLGKLIFSAGPFMNPDGGLDRIANLLAAFCGAGGALAAALLAELFMRARRRRAQAKSEVRNQRMKVLQILAQVKWRPIG